MKYTCFISVIASPGNPDYDSMKKIWIDNVSSFNDTSTLYSIQLYFLYANPSLISPSLIKIHHNIFDFYANCEEVFKNLFRKTIIFFDYVLQNTSTFPPLQNDKTSFFIRTNLSAVYQFQHLFSILLDIDNSLPKTLPFLGGSFIQDFNGLNTCFSGMNIIHNYISLTHFVSNSEELLTYDYPDDILLSLSLLHHFQDNIVLRNIPRLDFIETTRFFSCKKFTPNICCFRIKTPNRYKDTLIMKLLIDHIYKPSFDINSFVTYVLSNFDNVSNEVVSYNENYLDTFCSKNFKFEYDSNDKTKMNITFL